MGKQKKNLLYLIIFALTFAVIFIILGVNNECNASTITLEQIVDKINNCELMKEFSTNKLIDYDGNSDEMIRHSSVTCNENELVFDVIYNRIKGNGLHEDVTCKAVYTLEDNILKQKEFPFEFNELFVELILNAIGQLHGYEDGEIYRTIYNAYTSMEIYNYSLENEGIEYGPELVFSFKDRWINGKLISIDINKIIPIKQFDKTYIEADEIKRVMAKNRGIPYRYGDIIIYPYYIERLDQIVIRTYSKLDDEENIYKTMEEGIKATDFSKYGVSNEEILTYVRKIYPKCDLENGIKLDGFETTVIPNELDFQHYSTRRGLGNPYLEMNFVFDMKRLAEIMEEEQTPVDPEKPVDPVDPEKPVDPVDPEKPVDPIEPEQPVEPVEPEKPVEPVEPEKPVEPVEPEQPTDPVDPEKPTDPVDPEKPVDPIEPEKPVDPIEPEKPVDPVDPPKEKYPDAGIENLTLIYFLIVIIIVSTFIIGVITIPKNKD